VFEVEQENPPRHVGQKELGCFDVHMSTITSRFPKNGLCFVVVVT